MVAIPLRNLYTPKYVVGIADRVENPVIVNLREIIMIPITPLRITPIIIMMALMEEITKQFLKKILLLTVVLLNGCAVLAEYPTTVASTAIWGATGKSTTDHVLSFVTGKDCVTLRVFSQYKNEYICEEVEPEPTVWKIRGLEKLSRNNI